MGVVYQDVVQRIAVLANLHDLQAEALLNQSVLVVLTEHEFLTVAHVDGILLAALIVIDGLMATVVEDDTVLQHLSDRGTLVLIGSLQHLDSTLGIGSHATGEEVTAGTKAQLGRTERILDGAVGR